LKIVLAILLLAFCLLCNAQSFYCENITSREGLPDNEIRSMFKDSRGYLWIGTNAGVSRWNGEKFNTYNTLDGLAGNKVWWIDEDKNGNMWFACYGGGISQFNGQHFTSYLSKDGLVDNSVRVVKYSPAHDCLLIGTNKAISVLKDSIFYNFSKQNGKLSSEVIITSILADSNKAMFIDFLSNCYIMIINDEYEPVLLNLEKTWLDKYFASSCFINSSGDTIIGWEREGIAIRYEDTTKEINQIGQVFGIAEDCLGNIWIASWNGSGMAPPGGLFIFEDNKTNRLNRAYNIQSIMGWSAFYEKDQNLIFYGTLDKGLYKIPPPYFEYFPPEFFKENDLAVKDIEIDKENNIWFHTDSLLIVWDKNTYKKINFDIFYNARYHHEINSGSSNDLKKRIKKLNKDYINKRTHFQCIEFDNNYDAWISITNLGFFNMSIKNLDKAKFALNGMTNFVLDEADTLLQGDRWSKELVKFIDFKKSNKHILYCDSLYPILAKKMFKYQNEIWVCSRIEGVFIEKDCEFRTITVEDSSINKIVNDICFDSEGYAFLGGNDGRIEILKPETREKIFDINHENYDNSVHWLKISKNRLFAGYSDGLRVYKLDDVKTKKSDCQFFGVSEGYVSESVNSSLVDKEGNIWLATNDGLIKINTELFVRCNFQTLKTVIQKVEIFNKNTDWNFYSKTDPWSGLPLETPKLNPDQNHISIYYHTLNYNNPDADLYYYKLDGVDEDWIGPSDKKYVVYPYLNSGKYRFMVKSKNELSGFFTQTTEFKFVILTPWYQQTWFYLFMAALIFAFFILFYKIRVHNIRKKEDSKRDILRKISELESKALQAQMNPHFIFNSINSIQNYVLDNDVDGALVYLSSFSKILRMTLEFVDKKFISLSDELNYLQHYIKLENMRFDDLFDFVVKYDENVDPETLLLPPMLLQPIIENSIKHGIIPLKQKGVIKLMILKINKESFKCIIEDNGIGRVRSAQILNEQKVKKESKGLKITKERLDILDNCEDGSFDIKIIDLYSDNGEAAGTRVEITLAFILN